MRYGYSNGIGAFLAIAIGVSAFAGWLYTCYPTTATDLADESRRSWSFLVLLGFAVVGVILVAIGGAVLQGLMLLLRSLVQLALIVGLVVGGVWLWRREPPESRVQPPVTRQQVHSPAEQAAENSSPEPAKGRWWKENQSR